MKDTKRSRDSKSSLHLVGSNFSLQHGAEEQTTRQFEVMFDGLQEGWISVAQLIPEGMRVEHFLVTAWRRAAQRASELCRDEQTDVCIGPSVLKEKPRAGTRGTKEAFGASQVLWTDVDLKQFPQYQDKRMLLNFILGAEEQSGFKASLMIDSGNGFHLFWKLDEPVSEIAKLENHNRALQEIFAGDNVSDVTRIFRIAGGTNRKDSIRILFPKIISDTGKSYRISALPQGDSGERECRELSEEDYQRYSRSVANRTQRADKIPFSELVEDVLANASKRLKTLILEPAEKGRRSHRGYAISMQMLDEGYVRREIAAVLMHPTYPSGEKYQTERQNMSYVQVTLNSCLRDWLIKQEGSSDPKSKSVEDYVQDVLFYPREKTTDPWKRRSYSSDAKLTAPIIAFMKQKGYRFYSTEDKQGLIVTPEGELVLPNRGSDFEGWVFELTGWTPNTRPIGKLLATVLRLTAERSQEKLRKMPWAFLDRTAAKWSLCMVPGKDATSSLYVEAGGQVFSGARIRGGRIAQTSRYVTGMLEYKASIDPAKVFADYGQNTIDRLAVSNEDTRPLLAMYPLLLPMLAGSHVEMKPLLHLTGETESGKTTTLKQLSALLFGEAKLLQPTGAAAFREAANEIFMPLDDFEELTAMLDAFFLVAATGITREKTSIEGSTEAQQVHLSLALTSIGAIERPQTARRTLAIEISKKDRAEGTRLGETQLNRVIASRSEFWSGYLNWLPHLLTVLQETDWKKLRDYAERQIRNPSRQQLVAYLTLYAVVGFEFDKLNPGILYRDNPSVEEILDQALRGFELDQELQASENNPMYRMLWDCLEIEPDQLQAQIINTQGNVVQSVHAKQAHRNLNFRLRYVYRTSRTGETQIESIQATAGQMLSSFQVTCKKDLELTGIQTASALTVAIKRLLGLQKVPEAEEGGKFSRWYSVGNIRIRYLTKLGANYAQRGWEWGFIPQGETGL